MILVTGGTGLVGSHLLLHLLENNEDQIRSIYRNTKQIEKTKALFKSYNKTDLFPKIEWVQADILDLSALEIAFENVDYVYHCAAFISFDPGDESQLRKVNIKGTANIVNFCIDKKIKKIGHVSSIATLGDLAQNESQITEETEWNPEALHSDYAISKYGAEMEIWRGQQEGLEVVIVNPGVIIGPGFWDQGSGTLFTKVKNGLPFFTQGITGFVAVTDVVKILVLLMKSPIQGERFIVISNNYSFKDIIFTIADSLNVKRPKINAPYWLTNWVSMLDWIGATFFFQKRNISKDMVRSLYNRDQLCNQKIKDQLQFDFVEILSYINQMAIEFNKVQSQLEQSK